METKHTAGPWHMYETGTGHSHCVAGPSDVALATVHSYSNGHGPDRSQREANARLIAAAPELLAALSLVRMSAGWQYLSEESRAIIDAAISKATTKPED